MNDHQIDEIFGRSSKIEDLLKEHIKKIQAKSMIYIVFLTSDIHSA